MYMYESSNLEYRMDAQTRSLPPPKKSGNWVPPAEVSPKPLKKLVD